MIAEIIHYPDDPGVVGIKPLYGSANVDDLWLSFYDCGFNNMVVGCDDGYMNVLLLLTEPIRKYKSQGRKWDIDELIPEGPDSWL